ncbi:SDR family oxidoreductase [Modestobacter roseus]|uniref:NADP-dependent 3-hydroxy acid dehydrogenase YdfG n=1 Tax=Modestobacter roseus TaxID=1181884 RepID=A0A562INL8_9ACTN|nr:SDR family oxidoreductase [Modestobacter roseus]MQA35631.1 SDR family NAD(P)-dependent oxidoreductase [Modestobacter roseus]TWH72619.1 NADP-dependent 3-hydroxy acid dehydrogenase YdfG [Modestobacter roseus]
MADEGPRPPHRSQARDEPRDGAGANRTTELSGTVALVTGASAGIGRHLAQGLAARGAAVAGLARSADRLQTAMDEVAAATGARTLAVPADVTDRAAVESAVARVTAELGPVDLLVNNAGLMDPAEVPVWQADPDEWWRVVESHVRGPLLLVHAVVPGMVERGQGRVIDLGSGLSTRGRDLYSAYSVGKTGLMRLTEVLHAGLAGTGVHAFDLSPGVVETAMSVAMSIHEGRTEWTDPQVVVDLVAAIAAGELDQWSGRFVRAGADELDTLRSVQPEGDARMLRLRRYGDDDPTG